MAADFGDDGQPQTRAIKLAGLGCPLESVEYERHIFFRDAGTLVTRIDPNKSVVNGNIYLDGSVSRRELDGVGKDVQQCPLELDRKSVE